MTNATETTSTGTTITRGGYYEYLGDPNGYRSHAQACEVRAAAAKREDGWRVQVKGYCGLGDIRRFVIFRRAR